MSTNPPTVSVPDANGRGQHDLASSGIFHVTFRKNPTPDLVIPVLKWTEFKINEIVIDPEADERRLYSFRHDGQDFIELPFKKMKTIVGQAAANNRVLECFGALVDEYAKAFQVKIAQREKICGFTSAGWRLPDKYTFKFPPAIQDNLRILDMMMTLSAPTKQVAKDAMQAILDKTTIDKKEFFVAHVVGRPFYHALMPWTKLMPTVIFTGPGDIGKTSMLDMLAFYIWSIPRSMKCDNVNKESRLPQFAGISTFGFVIDEAQGLSDEMNNQIKSYTTSDQPHIRLRVDGSTRDSYELCSPPTLVSNDPPSILRDEAARSRCIVFPVDGKARSDADKQKFNDLKALGIQIAAVGRYIIEETRAWTIDDVRKRLDAIVVPMNMDARAATIYRLITFGALIVKEFLDITIDMTGLEKIIEDTREMGSDDIVSNVKVQLHENEKDPRDRARWMLTEIPTGIFKGTAGHVYINANFQDIRKLMNLDKNACGSLNALHRQIIKDFPDSQHGTFVADGIGKVKGIFIPSSPRSMSRMDKEIVNYVAGQLNGACSLADLHSMIEQEYKRSNESFYNLKRSELNDICHSMRDRRLVFYTGDTLKVVDAR